MTKYVPYLHKELSCAGDCFSLTENVSVVLTAREDVNPWEFLFSVFGNIIMLLSLIVCGVGKQTEEVCTIVYMQ